MLTAFVIIGTLTLAGSLVGLMNSRSGKSGWRVPLHGLTLALIGVAWWATHESNLGRFCLIAAAVLQVIAWITARATPPSIVRGSESTMTGVDLNDDEFLATPAAVPPAGVKTKAPERVQPDEDAALAADWSPEKAEIAAARAKAAAVKPPGSAAPSESASSTTSARPRPDLGVGSVFAIPPDESPDEDEPLQSSDETATDEPDADASLALSLTSEVLFSRECGVPPSVFVASLRRTGRRDAAAAGESDGPVQRIRIGEAVLEYQIEKGPRESPALEESLTHFEQPPDVAERARTHASRLRLTTRYAMGTSREAVVRIHHHAHAALIEFAPVVAAFWPDARMLSPVEQLPGLLEYTRSPGQALWRTCTHIRGFALAGDNEGTLLFDSVGLHAFGLPDVQVIAPAANEAQARATVELITERIFSTGCDLPHGTEFTASDGNVWRVNYTRSAFVPDREVVQLGLKTN